MTRLTRSPRVAADFIRRGAVVAFPTETVYGLGADVFQPDAVARIFEAKGRPADNPLIAHIASPAQVELLARRVTPAAEKFMEAFFPGPLTLVLPRQPSVPSVVTAGLDTVGIRMPRHPLAQAFLAACDTPVAAPSANVSGRPSPTTWQAVLTDLEGRIPCILQGGATEVGLESTVVDCSESTPVVLRSGAISLEALQAVMPQTVLTAEQQGPARSPGMRYKHYAPQARVHLADRAEAVPQATRQAWIGLSEPPRGRFARARVCSSLEMYAHLLYAFFRECDRAGMETIWCERVPDRGLGRALMDRIRRAAQG
ncbi:MAG: L-threonylcarbamoyladenylate synthase [Candidatus Xenobia bacterium]